MILKFIRECIKLQNLMFLMCKHRNWAVLVVIRDNNWGKKNVPLFSIEKNLESWRDNIFTHYILLSISEGEWGTIDMWLESLSRYITPV